MSGESPGEMTVTVSLEVWIEMVRRVAAAETRAADEQKWHRHYRDMSRDFHVMLSEFRERATDPARVVENEACELIAKLDDVLGERP